MPFKKGDRVLYKGKDLGTIYHDEEPGWQTVAVELDSEPGWVIQKLKTDLTPVYYSQGQRVTEEPIDLRLKLATISRFTGDTMRVGFFNHSDKQVAVIRATPAELQEFAIRILQQVQYTIEDKNR